jgi:EmrB/QacA subfamily drug resistance transporter
MEYPALRTRPAATTVALLVATFLSSMDVTVVGTALPRIVGQMGGLHLYSWVFSIFMLTSTVSVPLWGKLADLYGRKLTFLVGISIFLAGSLACGAAPTMEWLVAARALQGLGAGAVQALTLTIFADIYPIQVRARIQGVFSLVWGVSSVIGPLVGGFIVHWWSWRWIFYINLPVGAVAMALFISAFHEERHPRRHQLDWTGAALLTSGVSLLLYGLSAAGPLTVLVGLLLCAAFVVAETRAAEPLIPLDLFGDRVVAVASGGSVLSGALTLGYLAFVPLHLQGAQGIVPLWAGLATSPLLLAWATGSFGGGRLILRIGFRPVVRFGNFLLVVGNLSLWWSLRSLPSASGWVLFQLGTIAIGLGMGSTLNAFIIGVQERAAAERRGVATSIIQFARTNGNTIVEANLGAEFTSR